MDGWRSPRSVFSRLLPSTISAPARSSPSSLRPNVPRGKAIDAYTRAIAGSYYTIFNAPVCGSSVRLGLPLDMRRIATIIIDGRRYAGDAGGNFKPLH